MVTFAFIVAFATPVQERVPEVTLGARTGVVTEPFSDAMGMAESGDGRVVVSDRIDGQFALVDFRSGARQKIGRNGPGPNEYQVPFGPIRWRGDTLLGHDPNNRRYVKLVNGTVAGTIPFAQARAGGITGWAAPRAVDDAGRVYWDSPIIEMQPAVKRSMKARLIRWFPGEEAPEEVMQFADHGEFEHRFRFRPIPQTDAWIVARDGRIGILSAAEYRLRWYRDGAVVETGPPIPHTPTRITSAERDAFRARRLLEPMGGSINGAAPARPTEEQVRAAWPDSIFAEVMPPFEVNGALLASNGDIWVKRTGPSSAPAARVDILDPGGRLRATLRLPPRARLFALGARHVYLLAIDADGFQTLERYEYPALR